jgi:hypothetical protein
MSRRLLAVIIVSAICLFGMSLRAFALATEAFGNDPIRQGFGPDVLELANLKSRFYWYEVNGDPFFYYRGDAAALNEALLKFAGLRGAERDVIVLPGPVKGHNLTGDQSFAHDWKVHTPAGRSIGGPPTMTVYIDACAPAKAPDAAALARWIADLDSDTFAIRDRASQELEKMGFAAATALRAAKKSELGGLARRRIDQLLDRLQGIDLRHVEIPAGVTVFDLPDLLERCRADCKSPDPQIRGHAAGELGELARYADVVPSLVAVVAGDRHEYVRRCAAGALSRLGKKAAAALPVLRAGLYDPDVNVRNAFEYAIKQIEGAKREEAADDPIKLKATQDGIDAFCRKLRADPKK